MEEITGRERYIKSLLEWRAELLRQFDELGNQGASQEEVAGFNGLLRDHDQVISDSEARLFCLKFILARRPNSLATTSPEELRSYTKKKKKPKTTLGVSLPQDFIGMTQGDQHHIGLGRFDPIQCAASSRRVLLTGLPGSTTVTQVARGVAGRRGVLNIFVSRDLRADTVPGQLSAVVEFELPDSANRYVHFVSTAEIWFQDIQGLDHQIHATHILTPSNRITDIHPTRLGIPTDADGLAGRCIRFKDFPIIAIWALFKDFGVRHIVDAWISTLDDPDDPAEQHLTVEFTNIFEATRCCYSLLNGYFPPYRPFLEMISLQWTTSERDVSEIEIEQGNIISHVPHDHIEQAWNRQPFNQTQSTQLGKPLRRSAPKLQSPLHPRHPRHQEDGVIIWGDGEKTLRRVTHKQITSRMSTYDTQYILINDSIYSNFSIVPGSYPYYFPVHPPELDRLKAYYIMDPAWRDFWDEFSKTQGIDLRGYYAYALIAAERRVSNELSGRPYWYAGEMLEQAAVPQFILSYAKPELIRKVVNTSD
ncbi:hypothetical protein FPOA_07125 [Fusarium poae]|uniref:Uncharacterized protein n=1 Tax=Fusarium poae TaxID=36050 RepID=A0A1B8AKE0_FUSPO|nr:hypothetical protein FPOA_07125 [Fusarium poae]